MDITVFAAVAYATVVAGVIAFQLALALGAEWGSYAMGGAFPGRFPPRLRAAALLQAVLLALTVVIVLSRASLVLTGWSEAARWLIWPVVVLALLALVLNAITPSAGERRLWLPVTAVMVASTLAVAMSAG